LTYYTNYCLLVLLIVDVFSCTKRFRIRPTVLIGYNSKERKSRTLSKEFSSMSFENVRWLTETTASFPRYMHPASGPTTTTLKNAQDYFITKRSGFSWSTIPDFVVGRAGVDNWLLVTALARRAAVVDASRTITARHQVRSGYKPSAHFTQPTGDATVNYALAGRSFDYSLGLTDCAPLETVPAEDTWTASVHQHSNDCAERRTVVLRRRTMNRYCQRADVKLRGLHRLSRGAGNSHRNRTDINWQDRDVAATPSTDDVPLPLRRADTATTKVSSCMETWLGLSCVLYYVYGNGDVV